MRALDHLPSFHVADLGQIDGDHQQTNRKNRGDNRAAKMP